MGNLERVYAVLPTWAQDWAATGYGIYWKWLRFGPGYDEALRGFLRREYSSRSEWQAWQAIELRKLLRTCVARVPHYQMTWTKEQKRAASEGRLDNLPILEKAAVRLNPKAFVRKGFRPMWRGVFYTSGSTGTPVTVFYTSIELRRTLALREARSARWAGVSFSDPRATFSGRIVVPNPASSGPFHRYNAMERQVYFSAFHLNSETAPMYVAALWKHETEWLTGYAVSWYLLARHILQQNLTVPPIKAVVTTSEKVTLEMREVMEAAYGCHVFEEYSTVDNAVFASECEEGRLHVSPDSGIIEILRDDGTPCDAGEVGHVVATCLIREHQPLVRHRLGDLASWDVRPCPCGREMPVLKEVVGRIEDILVGPDGRQMVRFHGVFVDQPNIVEGQVIQEALDSICVRVVTTPSFSERDVQDLEKRIRQRLGAVGVRVERVTAIPRTKSGKFKAVVSLRER